MRLDRARPHSSGSSHCTVFWGPQTRRTRPDKRTRTRPTCADGDVSQTGPHWQPVPGHWYASGVMSRPLVHVLVINWNGKEHLRACYDSLLEGGYENVRYILIDNGSEDGSADFVRERYGGDDRVDIIECPVNIGWSGANNVGMERALEAGADYVFLLNNDTATAPDAVEHLVEAAEAHRNTGALAPKMVLFDFPEVLNSVGMECSIIGCTWDRGVGRLDAPRWDDPVPVVGACGGACFLRAAALRKTGLLPADFGIYLDDLDLCLRIWNAGYTVETCPAAVVRHKFSATMGQGKRLREKYYLNTRNRMRLVARNFPFAKAPAVAAALFLGECKALGRGAINAELWKIAAHVRAWAGTAVNLPKAFAERRRRRGQGLDECRFWDLVRTDRLFFPGVELPDAGWYAPRIIGAHAYRPMSIRAWQTVDAGRLRIRHANCYPPLGPTDIQVRVGDDVIVSLSTDDTAEVVIETPAATLEFVAQRFFEAERTGEAMDIGGWIDLEPF